MSESGDLWTYERVWGLTGVIEHDDYVYIYLSSIRWRCTSRYRIHRGLNKFIWSDDHCQSINAKLSIIAAIRRGCDIVVAFSIAKNTAARVSGYGRVRVVGLRRKIEDIQDLKYSSIVSKCQGAMLHDRHYSLWEILTVQWAGEEENIHDKTPMLDRDAFGVDGDGESKKPLPDR